MNGLDISDNVNYLVEEVTYRSMPSRIVNTASISTRPGDKLIATEWENKVINIKGRMFGSSYADLLSVIDTFQQNAAVQSLSLQLDVNRTYTATLQDLIIPTQFYNMTMIEYEANFLSVDPFAYAPSVTISGTTVSGTVTYSGMVTISGTVFAEPVLTITPAGRNAGDSGMKQIKITYTPANETVTVSGLNAGNFSFNSPIVIDYKNFTVTVSGIAADYTGIFSRWGPESSAFEITTISGLHNAFNLGLTYQPRYYQ